MGRSDQIREAQPHDIASDERVTSIPQTFLECLGSALHHVNPSRAIIFGSVAVKGLSARDLDLLVVSEFFKQILWQNRPKLLQLPPGPPYDLRLFTAYEFETFYPIGSPFRTSIEGNHMDITRYCVDSHSGSK